MMSDRRVLAGWFSEDLVRHGDGMVRLLASIGIDGRAMSAVQRAKAYQEWAMIEEAKAVAADIAERFGETGKRPRAQLRRIAALMGAEWMRQTADDVAGMMDPRVAPSRICSDGKGNKRTAGGIFFAVARNLASQDPTMDRRDFFRCFYDRPKQAKTKPVAKPKRPPPKKPTRGQRSRAESPALRTPLPRKQPVAAEVYVVRASRRAS
jgi:hypothetical protein